MATMGEAGRSAVERRRACDLPKPYNQLYNADILIVLLMADWEKNHARNRSFFVPDGVALEAGDRLYDEIHGTATAVRYLTTDGRRFHVLDRLW